jgi:hypothetical protein
MKHAIKTLEKSIRLNKVLRLPMFTLWENSDNMLIYSDTQYNHAEAETLSELIEIVKETYNVSII